jgi:hypothetical protein
MAITDEKVGLRAVDSRMAQVRAMAKMLDSAIRVPGTGIRFGLDAILGVVPGLGDTAGAIFSGYLILLGSRMGLPQSVITRMVANVAIDTIVGGIPILGDLFDVAWKSNTRNLKLLEQSVDPAYEHKPVNPLFIGAALLVLLLLIAGGIWLAALAIRTVISAVS